MGKKNDSKMQMHAAWMKDRGITRTTGQCPMGCGRSITNGGPALLVHLGRCTGKSRRF